MSARQEPSELGTKTWSGTRIWIQNLDADMHSQTLRRMYLKLN